MVVGGSVCRQGRVAHLRDRQRDPHPDRFLYGLQASNPVDPAVLYGGDASAIGGAADPLVGKHLGGVIVFGGGLALYGGPGLEGGLGVSGDSSCADHNVAWRVRQALGFDKVPSGVSPSHDHGIIYDLQPDHSSASGYGHPLCRARRPRSPSRSMPAPCPTGPRR
jgi:hypothetical protein